MPTATARETLIFTEWPEEKKKQTVELFFFSRAESFRPDELGHRSSLWSFGKGMTGIRNRSCLLLTTAACSVMCLHLSKKEPHYHFNCLRGAVLLICMVATPNHNPWNEMNPWLDPQAIAAEVWLWSPCRCIRAASVPLWVEKQPGLCSGSWAEHKPRGPAEKQGVWLKPCPEEHCLTPWITAKCRNQD